jgi:hypothetical protein
MKKTITLIAAVLVLCCASWGYVVNPPPIQFDYVNSKGNASSNTISWTHIVGSGSNGYLFVCVSGNQAPTTESISVATYNGTSMTLLATENVAGTGSNAAPKTWLYGLANPTSGSHTVTITASANGLAADSVSYLNVGDVVGVAATLSNTSPVTNVIGTSRAGSWLFACSGQHDGGSGDTNTHLINAGGSFVYDSNGPYTNVNNNPFIKFTFNPLFQAAPYITAEIRMPKPIRIPVLSQAFINLTTWGIDAGSKWGVQHCDFDASVWDVTTTPYTNISSSVTGITCDGTQHLTFTFVGNKTGIVVVHPNPTSALR